MRLHQYSSPARARRPSRYSAKLVELGQLPTEIYLQIIDLFKPSEDRGWEESYGPLLNLCLTCRLFCVLIQPIIFEHLGLGVPQTAAWLWDDYNDGPVPKSCIKSDSFHVPYGITRFVKDVVVRLNTALAAPALRRLTKLESVVLVNMKLDRTMIFALELLRQLQRLEFYHCHFENQAYTTKTRFRLTSFNYVDRSGDLWLGGRLDRIRKGLATVFVADSIIDFSTNNWTLATQVLSRKPPLKLKRLELTAVTDVNLLHRLLRDQPSLQHLSIKDFRKAETQVHCAPELSDLITLECPAPLLHSCLSTSPGLTHLSLTGYHLVYSNVPWSPWSRPATFGSFKADVPMYLELLKSLKTPLVSLQLPLEILQAAKDHDLDRLSIRNLTVFPCHPNFNSHYTLRSIMFLTDFETGLSACTAVLPSVKSLRFHASFDPLFSLQISEQRSIIERVLVQIFPSVTKVNLTPSLVWALEQGIWRWYVPALGRSSTLKHLRTLDLSFDTNRNVKMLWEKDGRYLKRKSHRLEGLEGSSNLQARLRGQTLPTKLSRFG